MRYYLALKADAGSVPCSTASLYPLDHLTTLQTGPVYSPLAG